MFSSSCWLAELLALLSIVATPGMSANDQLERITQAAAERQDAVRSLYIKWAETRTFAKAGGNVGSDMTLRRVVTVWLDGPKVKCEYAGQTRNNGAVVNHTKVDVCNGEVRKTYFKSHDAPRGWGKEVSPGPPDDFTANTFQPLLLSFRAMDRRCPLGLWSNEWSVSSSRERVNGEPCIVLRRTGGQQEESLALSPAKEYAPVQYARSFRGKPEMQIDITQEENDVSGWAPKSWRFVQLAGDTGKAAVVVAAKVEELEVNPEIAAATFDFDFPPETILYDKNTKANYLVHSDGRRTRVAVDTQGNILFEETGEGWLPPWTWFAAAVLMILLGFFCWKWRRSLATS